MPNPRHSEPGRPFPRTQRGAAGGWLILTIVVAFLVWWYWPGNGEPARPIGPPAEPRTPAEATPAEPASR